jgi:hypothetical protein
VLSDPAKNWFPNPVAMPSGCQLFGSGIVSGYCRAEAVVVTPTAITNAITGMRSHDGSFTVPPCPRGLARGDTHARRLWF